MDAPAADRPASLRSPGTGSSEPRRRRLVRELLYGRIVDHAAKTRARIGLTILVFALGYLVIAGRLVLFAAAPVPQGGRPWPPRGPTFSTATVKSWRPICAHPRCSASRDGSSMWMRPPSCSLR